MSDGDGRRLLDAAQRLLQRGDPESAYQEFTQASQVFAGPSRLLGGGHGWRGVAQIGLLRGDLDGAKSALERADALYTLGETLVPDGEGWTEVRGDLREARATCLVMSADVAMRLSEWRQARDVLDAAYLLYKTLDDRPSRVDLWAASARLAEREGRWFSARTAWEQVLRLYTSLRDEFGQCDARIRLGEALLLEEKLERADRELMDAEQLARELEDDGLLGRARIGQARSLELSLDWEAAWEKWLDARDALATADPITRGLADVRMAASAAHVRPDAALDLLQSGLTSLLNGQVRDAVPMVLHQLGIVAITLGDLDRALLAAVGARTVRGAGDARLEGFLFRILVETGHWEAAYWSTHVRMRSPEDTVRPAQRVMVEAHLDDVPTDASDPLGSFENALTKLVTPLCLARGLAPEELGTRRSLARLCEAYDSHVLVEPLPDPRVPVLVWSIREDESERFEIPLGTSLVGRGSGNAVRLAWDGLASRSHCALERGEDGVVWVRDLGSQHGTRIDGEAVVGRRRLEEGHRLLIGETLFLLEAQMPVRVAAVQIPSSVAALGPGQMAP